MILYRIKMCVCTYMDKYICLSILVIVQGHVNIVEALVVVHSSVFRAENENDAKSSLKCPTPWVGDEG